MYHFLALSGGYGGNSFYNSYGSNNPVPWPLLWWSLRNRATYLLFWLTHHLPFVLLYQLSYEHNPFLILFEIISFVIYAATYKTIHDGMVWSFEVLLHLETFFSSHWSVIIIIFIFIFVASMFCIFFFCTFLFLYMFYFYRRITCGTQTHLHNVTVLSLCHF